MRPDRHDPEGKYRTRHGHPFAGFDPGELAVRYCVDPHSPRKTGCLAIVSKVYLSVHCASQDLTDPYPSIASEYAYTLRSFDVPVIIKIDDAQKYFLRLWTLKTTEFSTKFPPGQVALRPRHPREGGDPGRLCNALKDAYTP
jgi:hypothetical protein